MFFSRKREEIFAPKLIQAPIEEKGELLSILFESVSLYLEIQKKIQKNLKWQILPPYYEKRGNQFRQEILSGFMPILKVKEAGSFLGKGLFATYALPKGSYIGLYTGIVRKRCKRVLEENDYCMSYPVHPLRRDYVIDAKERGNNLRYINHSDQPNLDLLPLILQKQLFMIFIAYRDIEKEEQLTFDYGELFWKKQKKRPLSL